MELLWQPPGAPSSRGDWGGTWHLAPALCPLGRYFWFRTPGPTGIPLGSDFSVWGWGRLMLVAHLCKAGDAVSCMAHEWLDRALSKVQRTVGQSRSSLGWASSPREDGRMSKPDRVGRVRVPGQTPGPSTSRETILGSVVRPQIG